jgi:hypothetical protein
MTPSETSARSPILCSISVLTTNFPCFRPYVSPTCYRMMRWGRNERNFPWVTPTSINCLLYTVYYNSRSHIKIRSVFSENRHDRARHRNKTATFRQVVISGHKSQSGLDTKTYWLTDRQSYSNFDFELWRHRSWGTHSTFCMCMREMFQKLVLISGSVVSRL